MYMNDYNATSAIHTNNVRDKMSRISRFGKLLIISKKHDTTLSSFRSNSDNLRALIQGKTIEGLFLAPPSDNCMKSS